MAETGGEPPSAADGADNTVSGADASIGTGPVHEWRRDEKK